MSSRLVRLESRSIKRGQSVGGAFSIGVCAVPIPRTIRAMTTSYPAIGRIVAQFARSETEFCPIGPRALLPAFGGWRRGRGLRHRICAETVRIQRFRLLHQRHRLLAELLVPVLLLRRLVGKRGVPPVKPGSAMEVHHQRLLIGYDLSLVAQPE